MAMRPNDSDWWTVPVREPGRLWKEPEVLIFCTSIFPGVSTSANAYDVANRRWYQLNIDSVVRNEEEWISETVTKHITEYYSKHETLPDFNVINTTRQGYPTTFEQQPHSQVSRQIRGNFKYGRGVNDLLPTTTFDEIKQKVHLSCSADRCSWKGLDCVFKRIEFQEDLEVIEREIRQREKLVRILKDDLEPNKTMQDRFGVLPILAIVNKSADTDETLGLLMPYGGQSLENLAGGYKYGMGYYSNKEDDEDEHDEHDPSKTNNKETDALPISVPKLPLTEDHFQKLVMNLWELARVGVLHGDINDRNTLYMENGQLILIDLGGIAPDYEGDAHALGSMMLWALDRVEWGESVLKRVRTIGICLQNMKENN